MSEITLEKVDQVIERTYATYAEAKEALEACDGDIEKSFDWLREKGIAKAAVFPVPVWASPKISRPPRATGIACC